MTLTRCAMMDMRCSEGCRLNSTISPLRRCRSTTSPTCTDGALSIDGFLSIVSTQSKQRHGSEGLPTQAGQGLVARQSHVALELACCRSAAAILPCAAVVDVAASMKKGVPTLSSDATFRLSAYLRKDRVPCWNSTMLAPGHAPPPASQALPSLPTQCSLGEISQQSCHDSPAALPTVKLYEGQRQPRKG